MQDKQNSSGASSFVGMAFQKLRSLVSRKAEADRPPEDATTSQKSSTPGRAENSRQLSADELDEIYGYPSQPDEPLAVAPPKWPRLHCEQVETLSLSYAELDGTWSIDDENGVPMVTAKISFPPQDCDPILWGFKVRALLRFTGKTGSVQQVDDAYWVGHSANTVRLDQGSHVFIILGTVKEHHWMTSRNEYQEYMSGRFSEGDAYRKRGEEILVATDCDGVKIDLSVVNDEAGQVAAQSFEIVRTPEQSYDVEMR